MTGIDLRLDDFTTMAMPDEWLEAVDIVVTDPPYAKDALPLYRHLGSFARRVLKPCGSLVTIVPHRYVPEAIASLSESLEYRWMAAMYQPQINARMTQIGIFVNWKPIVWFVKGRSPQPPGYRPDAFTNRAPSKALHDLRLRVRSGAAGADRGVRQRHARIRGGFAMLGR